MSSRTRTKVDEQAKPSNTEKDPHDWVTGGQTMSGAQASYLKTLSEEAGEPFDPTVTKAEASLRIDTLQAKTGRGRNHLASLGGGRLRSGLACSSVVKASDERLLRQIRTGPSWLQ